MLRKYARIILINPLHVLNIFVRYAELCCHKKLGMNKKLLYCIAAALWGIPGIPPAFTASFYSGLGPMLIYAACRFLSHRSQV